MNGATDGFLWDKDFPPVYGHTSISFLKRCAGFERAKHGDLKAAASVVEGCVKRERIAELIGRYPDAVLLPVITENMLPLALAKALGLRVCTGVRGYGNLSRKSFSAMERLLHKPEFEGAVKKGESYIIVDDIVTQGGTVQALREHVLSGGGKVAAVAALACSAGSGRLSPEARDVLELEARYGVCEIALILQFHLAAGEIRQLTRSQVRYLIRFKSADAMLKKMAQSHASLCARERELAGRVSAAA